MSACQRIAEHLDGYRDGELGFLARWRVERHLAGCDDCQRQLEALGRTGEWVRQAALADGGEPDFWPGIAPRLPALDAARRAESRREVGTRGFRPGLLGPVLGADDHPVHGASLPAKTSTMRRASMSSEWAAMPASSAGPWGFRKRKPVGWNSPLSCTTSERSASRTRC